MKVDKLCFNLTTDSAAQWFKFWILHVFLPVKNYLKKMKATDNDDCTFCGHFTETIEHNFISCFHSIAMWNQYFTHIYNTTSYIIILTYIILLLFVLELVLF